MADERLNEFHPSLKAEQSEAFYKRGEQAWQEYQRTGSSVPVEAAFARLELALAAKRAALTVGRTDQG